MVVNCIFDDIWWSFVRNGHMCCHWWYMVICVVFSDIWWSVLSLLIIGDIWGSVMSLVIYEDLWCLWWYMVIWISSWFWGIGWISCSQMRISRLWHTYRYTCDLWCVFVNWCSYGLVCVWHYLLIFIFIDFKEPCPIFCHFGGIELYLRQWVGNRAGEPEILKCAS